ncbi:MAG: response regulator [Candidatus Melainabacteria bacterium]|nr:response regulator [Candidatus Melainabacteria bacterium]
MFTQVRTYISNMLEKHAEQRALLQHLQSHRRQRPLKNIVCGQSNQLDLLKRRSVRQERFTHLAKLFRNSKNEHNLPASIMISVVDNLGCLPFTLSALSNHRHKDVRIAIAENPLTPDSVMTRLAFDENPDVRYAVAGSYNTSETVLNFLINDENPYVANRAQITMDHINGMTPAKEDQKTADATESKRVRRVLVVEDNPTLRDVTVRQLKILGFDASASENGKDALVRLSQEKFGLVLMDCLMPVMDGFEATMALRNTEAGSQCHIPVIALTARVMAGDKERCLASGMDGYLEKPVALDELRKILSYWFDHDADEKAYKEEIRNSISSLVDVDKLEEIHGNQPLDQLIEMLNKGLGEIVSRLSDSIYENDRIDLPRIAHELRGYAGVMACKSMEDASLSLEIAALKQDETSIMRGYRSILELVEKLEKKVAGSVKSEPVINQEYFKTGKIVIV